VPHHPPGRRVVHRGVATATGVIAGDVIGTVWFVDRDTEVAARRATT
jgi:hypothetical protein